MQLQISLLTRAKVVDKNIVAAAIAAIAIVWPTLAIEKSARWRTTDLDAPKARADAGRLVCWYAGMTLDAGTSHLARLLCKIW